MFSALIAAAALTYTNPVLYADYSDPDVIRVDKSYYLVASSFHFSPGIPVLQSDDLVHWRIIGHVLPKLPFAPEYNLPGPFQLTDATSKPTTGTRYGAGVWAPAIRHHNGLFYVYWPTPLEGVFMATAKNPAGPWSKPVQVLKGPGYEDPCPFWDDDGKAYLIHGRVGAGPLVLYRMSADGKRLIDDGIVIANDKVNLPVLEGPKLYKRDGWYYIFAPIGGVEKGQEVVGRARDIRGPYEWRVALAQGDTKVEGPHQGGYIETPSGQGWFLHFNATGAFGRIDWLEPVKWRNDWPVIGDPVAGQTYGQPVMQYEMPDTGNPPSEAKLQASDAFATATLGLQWSWNHNPDNRLWSLKARPGWLRLTASHAQYLVTARNTLTQVLQGPQSNLTARLDASHLSDGQRAGLALFGVKPDWIGVVRADGATHIALSVAGVETPGPAITGQIVQLRADVAADQTVRFAYSLDDGVSFTPMGDAIPLSRFSWWKGSRPALFSYTTGKAAAGYADIDWLHVEVTP